MSRYDHRQFNTPTDVFWLFILALALALVLVGAEIAWQKHVRNKQERIDRAYLRKVRRNDARIIQVAQEGQNDFS